MLQLVILESTFWKAIEECALQWMKTSGTSRLMDSRGKCSGPRTVQLSSRKFRQGEHVLHWSEKSTVCSGKRTRNREFPRRPRSSISSRTEQGNQAKPTRNRATTQRSKQKLRLTQRIRTFSPG